MREDTIERLERLTREFYAAFAGRFSDTRSRPWPGWSQVLDAVGDKATGRVLDIGCGNGRFFDFVEDQVGRPDAYVGVDSCDALIQIARERRPDVQFERGDLHDVTLQPGPFDLIVVFGVMHHIPGHARRRQVVLDLTRRLAPDGNLVFTFWRPTKEPRQAARMVDWCEVDGLDPTDVEPGDRLVPWARGGYALRYCHEVDDDEARALFAETGLEAVGRFDADGRSGTSNRYVVLRRPAS